VRELNEHLARRLVDSQFPQWADLAVTRVEPGGHDNRTFRLGDHLSVRLPSGEAYAAQVEKEQRWLPVLAPQLPLPIPAPLAKGIPGDGYLYAWSVLRWLEGEPATAENIADLTAFATELAGFLVALQDIDARGGPAAGPHNFFRGGPLATYEQETYDAIDALGDEIDRDAVLAAWDDAMATEWERDPVWVHGDVAVGNLLVRDGRLAGVIDFGSSGVGDPACDVVIAWALLAGESRAAFRRTLDVDDGTWARGRGWALWKSLITLAGDLERGPEAVALPRHVIAEVLADHARER
jgi:aminoglycoside phosphotransferase (APT) family kinase protein